MRFELPGHQAYFSRQHKIRSWHSSLLLLGLSVVEEEKGFARKFSARAPQLRKIDFSSSLSSLNQRCLLGLFAELLPLRHSMPLRVSRQRCARRMETAGQADAGFFLGTDASALCDAHHHFPRIYAGCCCHGDETFVACEGRSP
jgi:hypothetical protein